MNKISIKKNLSSMQVLKTLQVLLQGNFTMQELIERLNKSEEEPVFNNSVISKYINTCSKESFNSENSLYKYLQILRN